MISIYFTAGIVCGCSVMKFPLPDFKVIKAIKQTTPNETNNQTAPLNDPSKASMTKPIVKGAMKPATCIPKLTTPTAVPPIASGKYFSGRLNIIVDKTAENIGIMI